MTPFKASLEDILCSLRHVAQAGSLDGYSIEGEWDDETATDILSHFCALAEDVLAPLNAPVDREGAR